MMRLFIEPVDVWTFGDGRPFEAGEDHRRLTLFPPTAHTLQGAIRSRVLADAGVSLKAYLQRDPACADVAAQIGWPGEGYSRLRLRGPFIARLVNGQPVVYHPMPADVLKTKIDNEYEYYVAAPLADAPFISDAPPGLCPLWVREARVEGAEGWLSEDALACYLQTGKLDGKDVVRNEALFIIESRFGVMIDSQFKRPEPGHLFQMEFVRPRDGVGLVVDVEGVIFCQPRGFLKLGGDSRAARYTVLPAPSAQAPPSLPARFKVVFLTPAYFAGGWQPSNPARWFEGSNVRLVAAALRRPAQIGGFDLAKWKAKSGNPQKPLRRHTPAGSVYFFEADGPVSYTGGPFTEDNAVLGFGQITIGGWNYV